MKIITTTPLFILVFTLATHVQSYLHDPVTQLPFDRDLLLHRRRIGHVLTITPSNTSALWLHGEIGGKNGNRSRRYVIASSKWERLLLSFRIVNYTPDMPMPRARLAIQHAFTAWSEASRLEFYEIFHGDADIFVKFGGRKHGDGYDFDGKGDVLAHAFGPGGGIGGDVHFDEDEEWGLGLEGDTDLFIVATHELGHALGLDHSNVKEALMGAYYSGYNGAFHMPRDDVNGIVSIYGSRGRVDKRRPTLPPLPAHHTTTQAPVRPGSRGTGSKVTASGVKPTTTERRGIFRNGQEALIPEPCQMRYDAIALIRGERNVFIKRWYWRYRKTGLVPGYPAGIHSFWTGLDISLSQIDAAYETPKGRIVFFLGREYQEYEITRRQARPLVVAKRTLVDLGLPKSVSHVDAAFVKDGQAYIFSDDSYWKMEGNQVGEARDMSEGWPGVPHHVDSAFVHWDKKTYFFKGFHYWQFDDDAGTVTSRDGEPIKGKWMECEGVDIPNIPPPRG